MNEHPIILKGDLHAQAKNEYFDNVSVGGQAHVKSLVTEQLFVARAAKPARPADPATGRPAEPADPGTTAFAVVDATPERGVQAIMLSNQKPAPGEVVTRISARCDPRAGFHVDINAGQVTLLAAIPQGGTSLGPILIRARQPDGTYVQFPLEAFLALLQPAPLPPTPPVPVPPTPII